MKKMSKIAMVLASAMLLAGCGENKAEIAVVTDVGQLMDKGFNQGTWEGAKEFAEANSKTYQYYQPANGSDATDADRVSAMETAIKNGAQIIVTPGFLQGNAIAEVAAANPDVKFVFIDGWAIDGLNNVVGVSYKEEQSGYFAGYAAVKDGYTQLGGVFGGSAGNPACNRFAYGYVQGAAAAAAEKQVNVSIKVSFLYGASFSASPELAAMAGQWYAGGTEVIFSCGGSMFQSVLSAAQAATGKKVIGVDVDQAGESPLVLTSAVKGLNPSVQNVLTKIYQGKWDAELGGKNYVLGAAEDSTGIPTAEGSWRFQTFTKAEYDTLFNSVKSGTTAISNVVDGCGEQAFWTAASTQNCTVTLVTE